MLWIHFVYNILESTVTRYRDSHFYVLKFDQTLYCTCVGRTDLASQQASATEQKKITVHKQINDYRVFSLHYIILPSAIEDFLPSSNLPSSLSILIAFCTPWAYINASNITFGIRFSKKEWRHYKLYDSMASISNQINDKFET